MSAKNELGIKSTRRVLLVAGVLSCLYVFATAPRKVTIPAVASTSSSVTSSSGIELMNGSSVTVTYNLTCYDKTGATRFTKTGLTLAPKAKVTHAGNLRCSDGSTANAGDFLNNMVLCGYVTRANAANSCPTGYSLCTRAQVAANAGGSYYDGWVSDLSASTYAGTWSYTYDSGTNWYDTSVGYLPVGHTKSIYQCNSATTGTGTSTPNCNYRSYDGASSFCCAAASPELPSDSCQVEIDAVTSPEGFLQSPQFKGNSPF